MYCRNIIWKYENKFRTRRNDLQNSTVRNKHANNGDIVTV